MTQIHNLRSYLDVLEANGRLTRIEKPLSLEYELADVAAMLARTGGPAPLFTNVEGSAWPIFANAVTDQKTAALALGCSEHAIIPVMERVLDPVHGVPPERAESAPWQANVASGEEADATMLPLPIHSRGDGGAFVTGGVIFSKDPVSGRGNLSYNRMLRMGPRMFGFNVNEWRHVGQFMASRPDPEDPFAIAIAFGLDPAIMIAAGVKTEEDELTIAGAIRGAGVKVTPGITVDIDIPSGAEVILEGLVHPTQRKPEGPLAEFHGYHGELWPSPTFEVTAICWRDDPIFQTIIPGWYEHIYIGNVLPREPLLRRFVRHLAPDANVHIPPYANGFLAIIQIERDNPGQPKNLAMAAMTAHINIRNVVVVDQDIDMYDPAEIQWALTNRVDWTQDVFIVPDAQGHEMDPVAHERGVGPKLGVDATYKRERREYGERVSYPMIDLSKYL